MRVLFVMRNHGYMRNYASTIRMLAARGHEVVVGSRGPERHMAVDTPAFLENLHREFASITGEILPRRADEWTRLAAAVRAGRNALRYCHPAFRHAPKLTERAFRHMHSAAPRLARWLPSWWPAASVVSRALDTIERAIPSGADIDACLDRINPDAVVVTPLVDFNSYQIDYVKSARRRGTPVALAVASWDNLTNKGVIAVQPDVVYVWNEAQRREAIDLHRASPSRVRVTGAALFDDWFDASPSTSRTAFCARVGLDPGQPYLLYLCSSGFIAPHEAAYVRRWIQALRTSRQESLRHCGVLVRPHPGNAAVWQSEELADLGNVAVSPRAGALPLDEDAKQGYFDSLHHAAAVVGVNTSGMIEAGIVGRRSFSILEPAFADTQEGTVHFAHLTDTGFLTVASTLDEHHAQLAAELSCPSSRATFAGFLESFVRPAGLDVPATPRLVDAIEALPTIGASPERRSALSLLIARAARATLVTHAESHRQTAQ